MGAVDGYGATIEVRRATASSFKTLAMRATTISRSRSRALSATS